MILAHLRGSTDLIKLGLFRIILGRVETLNQLVGNEKPTLWILHFDHSAHPTVDVAEVEKCLGFRLHWDSELYGVFVFTPLVLRHLKSRLVNIQSSRCSIVPVVQRLKDSINTIQGSLANLG